MATSTQLIRDIVSNQSSAASVLQRFDIDLCLYGDESLQHACAELQLSLDQVLEKLSDAEIPEDGARDSELSSYSLHRLMQHIVRLHHSYLRRELPRLSSMAHRLAEIHGDRAPELLRMDEVLSALHTEIAGHLQKEEQILFPYIARMEGGFKGVAPGGQICFGTVAQPIALMLREHQRALQMTAELKKLSSDFAPPAWACGTQLALYAGLKNLETNLRQHLQVEDEMLFPRAISLESAGPQGD